MTESGHPRGRLLFVASEVFPLVKTGGLADVAGSLPAVLAEMGLDVRILLPGYLDVLDQLEEVREVARLALGDADASLLGGRPPRQRCHYMAAAASAVQ